MEAGTTPGRSRPPGSSCDRWSGRADHRGVGMEAGAPERLGEHDDPVFARLLLFGQECPADQRLDAEEREHVVGDTGANSRDGLAAAREIGWTTAHERNLFDGLARPAPFVGMRRIDGALSEGGHLARPEYPAGVPVGERPKEYGMNERENAMLGPCRWQARGSPRRRSRDCGGCRAGRIAGRGRECPGRAVPAGRASSPTWSRCCRR